MTGGADRGGVRARPAPACPLCGAPGPVLHADLRDRMFAAPGAWDLRACEPCGMAWLDPRPWVEDIPRLYAEYFTHVASDERRGGWRRRLQAAILAHRFGYPVAAPPLLGRLASRVGPLCEIAGGSVLWLPAAPGARLLEIGCGNGTFLSRMRALGWTVCGVEPDTAAARLASSSCGLEIHAGDVATAPYPPAAFDVIVLSHVIEHLHDPVVTLERCRALLRPGGRLIAVTPNFESRGRRRFGAAWVHLDPPRHLRLFGPRALAATARAAGLEVYSLRSTARDARWAHAASAQIERHGRFPHGVLHSSRVAKLRALAFQAREHLARDGGEELVLLATRSA